MVAEQFRFVGYDQRDLALILCGLSGLLFLILWIATKKAPLTFLAGSIGFGIATQIRTPDCFMNLGVLIVIAIGTMLETKITHINTTRSYLVLMLFAAWTMYSLFTDATHQHGITLRDDMLIARKDDKVVILHRAKLSLNHRVRRNAPLESHMEYWEFVDGDQTATIYADELFFNAAGQVHDGDSVGDTVAKWAKVKAKPVQFDSGVLSIFKSIVNLALPRR